MKLSKESIKYLYSKIGDIDIDKLYMYSCLKWSGFDDDLAFDYIDILRQVWLKDEMNRSLSYLSDGIFEIYENIGNEVLKMTPSEILEEFF